MLQRYMLAVLFCLGSAFSFAQNSINLTLIGYTYDCNSGKLNVNFNLHNVPGDGSTATVYSVYTGTNAPNATLINLENGDILFTDVYTFGNSVTITAEGTGANNAPYTAISFVPVKPDGPAKPMISPLNLVLCDGEYGTLTANGSGGDYTWSSGSSGATLNTNQAGTWTVHQSNYCGVSPESDPATTTLLTKPQAPTISSSSGAVLCNGTTTNLSASPAYGGAIWWNTGESGNTINTANAGTYYVWETNACGVGANSNSYVITTASTPAAPVLNLSGTKLLCDGATQNLLTAPASSGGVIHWSTGETANNINVNAAGNYYAYEYNPYCGAGANSASVIITTSNTPVQPSILQSGPITLCNGESTILNSFGLGTISWYKDGASYGITDNQTTVSAAGNYYTHCTNACGISLNSNPIQIITNNTPPAPSLNVGGAITLCDGAGQFLNTSPSTSGGVIHWSNGITSNNQSVTAAGGYYAYETNPGCGTGANSATVNITTLSKPTAPTVTPTGNLLLCNGTTTTLSSSGANITWSNGATGNTMVTGIASTYYSFDRNYCGNSPNSNSVTITTATCPPPTPGTNFSVCPGTQKTLDAGAGYDTYLWSNGQTTRTVNVGPGTYTVTVTKYGCSAISNAVTVSYYSVTTPTITSSGSTIICSGASVNLMASGGTAYLWSNGNTTNNTTVTNAGGYFVTVTDNNGCNTTSATTVVTVRPLPTAAIMGDAIVCRNFTDPIVRFSGANATAPYTFTYRINSGSNQTVTTTTGNTVNVNAPTTTDGTYLYELISIKESSSTTCQNTATGNATVIINPLPTATVNLTVPSTVCQGATSPQVTFTANGGTAPYSITYSINGGIQQTITTTGNTVSINAPTNTAGTFIYSLISVQDNSITHCANAVTGTATVTINPLPIATIIGNDTICQNSSTPLITFTGSNATAPYTFYYSINGEPIKTVSSLGNMVTVPAPTATAGNFTYSLVSIEESSSTHCANTVSGSATINIHPLPIATISGTSTTCQNSLSPTITFTGSNATPPYTFTYRVNGGANKTITTVSGNSVTIDAPTNIPGTFTYTLISIQESSSTNCINPATGNATITINPLPKATISGTTTICQNSQQPLLTFTGSNATAPYIFTYSINGGTDTSITSFNNTITLPVSMAIAGTYTYSLISVLESSSTACSNNAAGSAIVTINPLPLASIEGTTTICQNSNQPLLTLKGTNATAPYTFTYSINGSTAKTIVSNDSAIIIPAPTNVPGNFLYSLISVKENSSTKCNAAVSGTNSEALIKVNELATATIKGADTVCQFTNPIPILFTATGGVAPYTFTYRINNGTPQSVSTFIGNTAQVLAPTNIPGPFTYELVSVQESSSTQCINPANNKTTVLIHPLPAKAVLVAPQQHLCNGAAGQITIYNYTAGNSYTWYYNGSLIRTTTNDTIVNSLAGGFNVMATSDHGCDAASISDTLTITTGTIARPVITGSTKVCEGGKTKLLVAPENTSLIYETINWINNNKTLSKEPAYSATAGAYTIAVKREGCADSLSFAVTNNDTVFPTGTLTTNTQHIAYGQAIQATATIDNALIYQWDFGDGNTATTNTNEVQQNIYKASDSLTIKLHAVSERNCISSFTTWIKVDPPDTTHIPNLSMAGKLKDWNLYPIPFHDRLRVSIVLLKDEPIRIDAFSNAGQWVRSWQFKGITGENLFDLDKLFSLPSNLSYLFVTYYNNTKHATTAYKY